MSTRKPAGDTNIVVFGAGSIGCYLGGCLLSIGASVTFIGRQRIQSDIATHGLTVTDWQGRNVQIGANNVNFTCDNSVMADADYILVCVKSGDTPSAGKLIAKSANANAVVVSFQNGIRNGEVLAQCLPHHEVIKGMVPFNVLSQGAGHFHCGTEGNLSVQDNNAKCEALLSLFATADLPVKRYHKIASVQWGKLLMNLNNAVNALSGLPLLTQLNDRAYRKVMAVVLTEALAAMKAAGIQPAKTGKVVPKLMPMIMVLPDGLFKLVASATLKIDPQARSSMYEDFVLGRKTEIDFLNGEIVRLGKQYKVNTPANAAIVRLVNEAEAAKSGSPYLTAQQLHSAIT